METAKIKHTAPELKPLSEYGDLMTRTEFVEAVQCGAFIDSDGIGSLATATEESSIRINPSNCLRTLVEHAWASHVIWFNK